MTMKLLSASLLAASLFAMPAFAALKEGDVAPQFAAPASLAGKEFKFDLAEALKKGPVVLYFYPAAFTKGCTIEAHEFAEATDQFNAMGATVIGASVDDIATLNKFSVSECRNKFAVAAVDKAITKSYDVSLWIKPSISNRTSYVIAPDGKIIFTYSALDPDGHVEKSMAAVKKWHDEHK
jgi:peroxiredoxin